MMASASAQSSTANADTIRQLNDARKLALRDASLYSQIVGPVLPLINASKPLELQRWGADFLSQIFSSPVLALEAKTKIALESLSLLREYLESDAQDEWVLKSAIQAAASIYPLIFRYIINNPNESQVWQQMSTLKSNILRRIDSSAPGVHVCCIKFVQRVVQTQTPGLIIDPRNSEANEISLALVPRDHPIIPPSNLEAEASGLLDRLLGMLQENNVDALLVTATLNSLGGLIRTRASISNKILNIVLNYNPLNLANSPMTLRTRLMVRSLERTTRSLLLFVMKKQQNHPLAGRIDQYLQRLHQSRVEIFDEGSRKRGAPIEPTDGLDSAKRQRLAADVQAQQQWPPPLPAGPISVAQLFTLTDDQGSRNFDVKVIAPDAVLRILVPLLHKIDSNRMNESINAVRARWLQLTNPAAQTRLNTLPPPRAPVYDDDDDYEPDFPTEDAEQLNNRLDQDAAAVDAAGPEMTLGPFRLPTPPPLSDREIAEWSTGTVDRVFGYMSALSDPPKTKSAGSGFGRLAARNHDHDAWMTIISRLAARAPAGLEGASDPVKQEEMSNGDIVRGRKHLDQTADVIRERLVLHVVQDFRRRIDDAITWLNEEWYNDKVQRQDYEQQTRNHDDHFTASEDQEKISEPVMHYEKWLLRILDGIVPYLDAKDKVLIRFLSEVPELPKAAMDKVKSLARDPERVTLATNAIHYLIMLKPPVREIGLDALEDMWRNYSDAKVAAAKVLTKWRPHVLQSGGNDMTKIEPKQEVVAAS